MFPRTCPLRVCHCLFLHKSRSGYGAFNYLNAEGCILASVFCWRVCWHRNQILYGHALEVGEYVIEWASNFLAAYREAQLPKIVTRVLAISTWTPPVFPWIKVNFDVGYVDAKNYQVAVVARDSRGSCLWWRVRRLVGQPSAVVGEARDTLQGVLLALEKGWTEWELEGDCFQITTAIQQGKDDTYLPFGYLIATILSYVRLMPNFSCYFVRRSGNRLAHSLAHIFVGAIDVLEDSLIPADLA